MSDNKYVIRKLSLSRLGDLLRERLGTSDTYTFPEDFEQAIIDTDMKAIIFDGNEAPYDITVVGNMQVPCSLYFSNDSTHSIIKTLNFIGVGNIDYTFPDGSVYKSQLSTDINLPSNTVAIRDYCFKGSQINSITGLNNVTYLGGNGPFSSITGQISELILPEVTTIGADGAFDSSIGLTKIKLPKWTTTSRSCIRYCTGLTEVQLGSVGYPIASPATNLLVGCNQSGLTIICYIASTNINTALTRFRTNCPNATIIIKAPYDLTYDGVSYSAGDTVVTSNP